MATIQDVTVITVNRKTKTLTKKCVESLMSFYPTVRMILVDNGSKDESLEYVKAVAAAHTNISCILNTTHGLEHSVGLNLGVSKVRTGFFLTLDSDVIVLRGGWIEEMLRPFVRNTRMLVIGYVGMNSSPDCTRPPRSSEPSGRHSVHPFCALWHTKRFLAVGVGFQKIGAPTCSVCKAAQDKGYQITSLPGIHPHNKPIPYYINHVWGGTRTVLSVLNGQKRAAARKK